MFNKKKNNRFDKWRFEQQKKNNPNIFILIMIGIIGVGVSLLITSFLIYGLVAMLGLIVQLPTWAQLSFGQCFVIAVIFAIVRTLFRVN